MPVWRAFIHGLKVLTRRRAADRDLDDELSHYYDELVAALEAQGHPPADARRMASLQTGIRGESALAVREQVRDAGWEGAVGGWFDDVRYAVRRMARAPAFTATAVLTLALGMGGAAAIFSVADGVLWKPLPYAHAERLVALTHAAPGINLSYLKMSPSLYFTYREEGRVFEDLALWNGNRSTVTGLGDPEEVPTLFVTHQFLDVLGVLPALGRGLTAADGNAHAEPVAILSHGYWKGRFGGSESVIGRRIQIDGSAHEVIGVLPASFEFLDERVSLIVPRRMRREEALLIQFSQDGIARLKPGVTLDEANADVTRCLPLAALKFPLNPGFAVNAFADARITPNLRRLQDHQVGAFAKTLWILLAAAGILLLIACANVANLLLVRAGARRHELAIREALGAGRVRLARDLVVESLLLSSFGGVLGMALAWAALRAVTWAGFATLPRLSNVAVDSRTGLFTLAASFAAGLLLGCAPIWKPVRGSAAAAIRGGGARSMTQNRHGRRTQRILLSAQVALAMVLLVGSGLMLRTFQALRAVDPGFRDPESVQIVRVSIPATQIAAPELLIRTQEAILSRFSAIPGVAAAAISNAAPLEGGASSPVYSEGHEPADGKIPPVRQTRLVSPGFAAALESRLVAGRDYTWSDLYNGPAAALISENMARELWGDPRAAVGKRIRPSLNDAWSEVIGVVADLRDEGVTKEAPKIVYWPLLQKARNGSFIVPRSVEYLIRTPRAGSVPLVQDLRQALRSINANLPLANVRTLAAINAKSVATTSFVLLLLVVAGSIALLLGAVGIYGVIAYSVSQRRKEIGIRIALGSTPGSVTAMFVRQGLLLAGPGAALGILLSLLATGVLRSLLFGVSPLDPWAYASTAGLLVATALFASWLPARKAASLDPIEALRAE